ncbi:U-box domain-containing protein 12-like [Triticum dicoccoides]|uniref:U-box domain-containing protein 12-like n=1 Tax=Triticum dicoccoides TaxID=85692 RepID=UPI00188F0807|nr:U-box domain-containing protein 12-like [Triticum dicoccoides]
MREGAYRGRKNALVSLHGVLHSASNIGKAVSASAVSVLANLLSDDRQDFVDGSVALLATIAEQPAGATANLASSDLVNFLGASASRSGKDHYMALLASMCWHRGDKVIALMGKMTRLMPALYAIIAHAIPLTHFAKRKTLVHVYSCYLSHMSGQRHVVPQQRHVC